MPQASEEVRAMMCRWFGCIDCEAPLRFLLSHGFKHNRGTIEPPTKSHNLSDDESYCIAFLVQEWDYDYARGYYRTV